MEIPRWISRRLISLHRTGQLILNYESEFAIEPLSYPKFAPELTILKHLSLTGLQLTSLEGFPVFPRLQSLIADRTLIDTLINFKCIAGVTKVSLKNTPISQVRNYKLSLMLVCGPKLCSISGTVVSPEMRQRIGDWPDYAAKMANQGWIAEWPAPDEMRWHDLREHYDIGAQSESESSLDQLMEADVEDFDALVMRFRALQESMWATAESVFRTTVSSFEDELLSTLCGVFKDHGICLAEEPEELLRRLEAACQKAQATIDQDLV
jgi:hypothetical protein